MATYINQEIRKKNIDIYNLSDLHVGSKAFHEKAFKEIVQRVLDEKAYVTLGGDLIEGKTIDSPHFNPEGLRVNQLNIHAQADAVVELLKPIKSRLLMSQIGNHELYLLKNFDIMKYICKEVGRPDIYGHYQTWLNVNGVTMFFWHGRPTMPRGAKDPIQREANQKAWLKNRLQGLAGSAQAMYMAHTHQVLTVKPIRQYALLDHGDNVHGTYFVEQPKEVNGDVWIHPDGRFYANTGTFRRGGGFDHIDYCEISGFTPPPIGCIKTTICENKVINIKKVIL